MKKVFIIAAALIAALPVAQATTYLYSFTGTSGTVSSPHDFTGNGSYPITIWGMTYSTLTQAGTGSTAVYSFSGGAVSNLSLNATNGLGVVGTCNEITVPGACGSAGSYAVVDFADTGNPGGPEGHGYTAATITIDNADSGWTIYGGTSFTSSSGGITGLTKLVSGTSKGISNTYNQLVSLTGYAYLVITAGPTSCELNVNSISVSTPEPGTFVMAGMALIGLGMALRKARKG